MITAMLNGAVLGQPEPINKYDFKTLPFVPYGDAHTRHHGGDFPEVFGQIEGKKATNHLFKTQKKVFFKFLFNLFWFEGVGGPSGS